MSLRDKIKKEAESGGFRPHPVGTFPGVIEEVKETQGNGEYSERTIYEIHIRTEEGKARASIWKVTAEDIDGYLLERANNREEAEERYLQTMGRVVRLYKDLGLDEPEGETDEEFEAQCWDRIGEFVGRPCSTVVKEGKAPKEDQRIVFINAPREERATAPSKPAAKAPAGNQSGKTTAAKKPAAPKKPAAAPAAGAPDLSEIPF